MKTTGVIVNGSINRSDSPVYDNDSNSPLLGDKDDHKDYDTIK